jgi:hypothetical protein
VIYRYSVWKLRALPAQHYLHAIDGAAEYSEAMPVDCSATVITAFAEPWSPESPKPKRPQLIRRNAYLLLLVVLSNPVKDYLDLCAPDTDILPYRYPSIALR